MLVYSTVDSGLTAV